MLIIRRKRFFGDKFNKIIYLPRMICEKFSKIFFFSIKTLFHVVEYTIHAVEYTFLDMNCIFHAME